MSQTIRGTVNDAADGAALSNVSILLTADASGRTFNINSDSVGQYRFDNLVPGYYQITANLTGYGELRLKEIQVNAGKERVQDFLLTPGTTLATVDIVEDRYGHKLQPVGEIALSREQTLRYPMTYNDPARLATAYAGVAQTDDGTNTISVRGNNPSLLRWRLEGVDIVAPNHLPNAGTLSDQSTVASGGILMLSAQMLDNASLHKGNYSAQYGDAIAGVMDLRLRRGNNQHQEATIQAGLIGLDAAIEGPFNQKGKSSYLINYRYSTVGLLGKMGVSFGGEKITFQDIAANFYLPTEHFGTFTVFGLYGNSNNKFFNPDTAKIYKDLFRIDYNNNGSVFGFTHFIRFGKNFWWRTNSANSFQSSQRNQTRTGYNRNDHQEVIRLSNNSMLNYKISESISFQGGITINYMTIGRDLFIENSDSIVPVFTNGNAGFDEGNLQLWVQTEGYFDNRKGFYQVGLHGSLSSFGALDPRFLMSYQVHPRHKISAAIGLYSQLAPFPTSSFSIPMMRSSHYALRHNWTSRNEKWIWRTELFRQGISRVILNTSALNSYTTLNETDPVFLGSTNFNGTGQNYGIETGIERFLDNGWYLNGNITLLHSVATGSDGRTYSTRWDIGEIINLTAGKEWVRKQRKGKPYRMFGANGHIVYMGGSRAYPVDLASSANANATIYSYVAGPTDRYPDYYRIDGRVYWKRSIQNRRNSTFALEFQNLAFRKNVAFRYYEPLTHNIVTKYQLGLIPNMSWRLEL